MQTGSSYLQTLAPTLTQDFKLSRHGLQPRPPTPASSSTRDWLEESLRQGLASPQSGRCSSHPVGHFCC